MALISPTVGQRAHQSPEVTAAAELQLILSHARKSAGIRMIDLALFSSHESRRPTDLSVLLLIIVALVTGRLLRVVDLTAGQHKEVRVPLLQGEGWRWRWRGGGVEG